MLGMPKFGKLVPLRLIRSKRIKKRFGKFARKK